MSSSSVTRKVFRVDLRVIWNPWLDSSPVQHLRQRSTSTFMWSERTPFMLVTSLRDPQDSHRITVLTVVLPEGDHVIGFEAGEHQFSLGDVVAVGPVEVEGQVLLGHHHGRVVQPG